MNVARPAPPMTARPPARSKARALSRETHEPDYSILIAVTGLAAIGIIMVFSSSAIREYLDNQDALALVAPQILWAALGLAAMLVMSRIDYRWLRVISVPGYLGSIVVLVLVFLPELGVRVGGSARWLDLGLLPRVHPAEVAKLFIVIYLAHWMAGRGRRIGGLRSGLLPFLILLAPVAALIFAEPDLGTTSVVVLTGFTMFFVAGGSLVQLGALFVGAVFAALYAGLRGYQMDRIRAWLDPWAYADSIGFQTIQGLMALGLGGLFGAGLGESRAAAGLYLPNASNDFIFAIIGEEFGFVGASLVVGLFLLLAYAGIRTALAAQDTFGALLATGITAWLCIQAFINMAVVVSLIPITGIPLPFVSQGGSSLIISFAAAGILLSISRETVEKGTWNDAPDDRGRRDGRAHLPGPGRRPDASRAPGRT
jgi:cell division protein FtsW